MTTPAPRRRRRRWAEATGTAQVAWRAKGPVWVMKYRLPDATESMKVLGPAWVKPDPAKPRGWLARRGRPPEGTLTEDAAAATLRAFLDQQTDRTPPERVTFARCAQAFLERCEEKGRSPTTMRTYRQVVAELTARWEGWRIVDVDADELEDYRDELAERGLAASTLNQRRAVLSGIFKLARRRYRVGVDPLDGFERAEIKADGDLEVYSVEEVWALVRAAASLTDAAIFLVAALCGLRRSEILGLRWRAVLFDQRALLLRRGYTDIGGDRLPKGQHVHSVPTAPQVHELLTRLAPDQPDPRVFAGEKGDAMDASALYRRYIKAQGRAGIRRLRFHDLRHTFGTQAIASGAYVMDVKDWMGHRHCRPPCATSTTSRATRPPSGWDVTSVVWRPSSTRCWAIPRGCEWAKRPPQATTREYVGRLEFGVTWGFARRWPSRRDSSDRRSRGRGSCRRSHRRRFAAWPRTSTIRRSARRAGRFA